jgi:hypothetical protein
VIRRARFVRLLPWIALAVLLAGLAGVIVAGAVPVEARGAFPHGFLYPLRRYDQALSLVALGLVLAQLRGRTLPLIAVLFAASIALGGYAANLIVEALLSGADIFHDLLAIPPFCCVLAGLGLALPQVRTWIGPPAAFVCGIALGMVLNFDDPTGAEWAFAGGTVLSGLWLVLAPLLLWRAFERPWIAVPARIFGSWVLTIGILLGSLHLMPPPAGVPQSIEPPAAGAFSGGEDAVVTAPSPR